MARPRSAGYSQGTWGGTIKSVVAAKRMEALNISKEEQATAPAAPAMKKRISKPTAKAAAIARASRVKIAPKKLRD